MTSCLKRVAEAARAEAPLNRVGKNAIEYALRAEFYPRNSETEIRQLCRITTFQPLPFAAGRIGGAKRSQVDKDMILLWGLVRERAAALCLAGDNGGVLLGRFGMAIDVVRVTQLLKQTVNGVARQSII